MYDAKLIGELNHCFYVRRLYATRPCFVRMHPKSRMLGEVAMERGGICQSHPFFCWDQDSACQRCSGGVYGAALALGILIKPSLCDLVLYDSLCVRSVPAFTLICVLWTLTCLCPCASGCLWHNFASFCLWHTFSIRKLHSVNGYSICLWLFLESRPQWARLPDMFNPHLLSLSSWLCLESCSHVAALAQEPVRVSFSSEPPTILRLDGLWR